MGGGGGLGWGWDGYRWEGGKAGMLANVSCLMSLSGSDHSYSSVMAPPPRKAAFSTT